MIVATPIKIELSKATISLFSKRYFAIVSILQAFNRNSPQRHLLVSLEDIAGVYLLLDIIQTSIIAVGDDSLALLLEEIQVVHHAASKESTTILQFWLIDNHLCTLCLDTLPSCP